MKTKELADKARNMNMVTQTCGNNRSDQADLNYRQRGVSQFELMAATGIAIILSLVSITSVKNVVGYVRIAGDTRGLAAQLALTRMRAASAGAKTRLNCNLTANTCQTEVWNKSNSAYQVEGGVEYLSAGDVFGYGTLTTAAGQQGTIAQTSPIYFNSRGIATDSSGNATANSAIYITNKNGLYAAIAVSIAGQPTAYKYTGSAWAAY